MKRKNLSYEKHLKEAVFLALTILLLSGCSRGTRGISSKQGLYERRVFVPKEITPEQAKALLSQLDLGTVTILPESNALAVTGSPSVQQKASVVLDLVDTKDKYIVEVIAPISAARSIPTNEQISSILGNIAIGTFADPPERGKQTRAIIDIHGESIIAVTPVRLRRDIATLMEFGPTALHQARRQTKPPAAVERKKIHAVPTETAQAPASKPAHEVPREQTEPIAQPAAKQDTSPEIISSQILPKTPEPNVLEPKIEISAETQPKPAPATEAIVPEKSEVASETSPASEPVVDSQREQQTVTPKNTDQEPSHAATKPAKTMASYELEPLANGEDVLELDLPDQLEMSQLLDLVAEYLNLDYMFDPEKIKGQTVSLRLHGKLQGEISVKDLYPLLESVLKFKGFVMTCHKGNLVTIVPVTDALEVDPALLDSDGATLEAGDIVVTRVFDLQYVNTASAMNLLDSMKLSVAASPIEETQTLIVTCYAHRMARIERLLNMVDRPGRPREFRFRQLQYTMAATLAAKVEALVAELQTKPVRVSPMEVEKPPSPPILTSGAPSRPFSPPRPSTTESSDSTDRYTVYLDTDERTNRILMIGYAEQLAVVEEVIDALDVAQHDPRAMKVYNIVHLSASDAKKKLEELEVIGKPSQTAGAVPSVFTSRTSSSSKTGLTDTMERAAMEETQVTVLETTNSLLINATDEQHNRIGTIIRHIDVAPQDLRILRVYDIKHIDAENVKKKLAELELVGKKSPADSAAAREPTAVTKGDAGADMATMQEPQVTVREATNSLLINATEKQHARIATIIDYIDVVQQDLRTLKVYDIQYVDADEVKKKLTEFELIGKKRTGKSTTTPASGPLPSVKTGNTDTKEQTTMQEPQVAVLESTNSLLINATEFQHAQMASIIKHVDAEVRKEAIPYEIYFLENQDPEALAEVLGKLIQETIRDKEDKIEQVARKTQEEIIIVPDKGTFSLVVYASRKNQEWVSKLIKALDRRRPQVLLDATLVEIRKTEEFDYDLNLIQSFPNLVATSGLTGTIVSGSSPITSSDIIEKLASSGRDRFIDYQSNSGDFKGFYGDKHINVLLGAMQSKNYGRVLAKPKVLVNDNETGTIQTVDSTYVERKTSIPVVTGAAGQQSNLIETAIDFEKYDAGITLNITPHISEGDLLRLEIKLTRSDFGTVTGDKPPDQTSSDINTIVTVPDGSTIILGGMLKLNQSKSGKKVPILGDLPLVGGLFRSTARSDIQSKLYVFVRAEIIRPEETLAGAQRELERISERDRAAFERHEEEFQNYKDWPGIKPKTIDPIKVLETR